MQRLLLSGLSLVVAVLIVISMSVAGCTGGGTSPATKPGTTPAGSPTTGGGREGWPTSIVGAGGSGSSTNYLINAGLCKMISSRLKIQATPMETGASLPSVNAMKKDAAFAVVSSDAAWYAWQGIADYKNNPIQIRGFAQGYVFQGLFMTKAESGIKTFQDFRGKVCYFDNPKSPIQVAYANAIYKYYKIDPKKDFKAFLSYTGSEDAMDALKEGRADAVLYPASHPAGFIMDVADTINLKCIPLEKGAMDAVVADSPFMMPGILKAGTYRGVDADVLGPAFLQGPVISAALPDSLVYEITKLVYDPATRAEWESFHPACKEFKTSLAESWAVPFHAGAIKYYKEVGAWTDKLDKRNKEYLKMIGMEK